MHLFTVDDIGSLNRDFFFSDPVSRFRYENVHEAKKGLAGHYAERILMLQGKALDLGVAHGFTSDEN